MTACAAKLLTSSILISSGTGQFGALQSVAPSFGMELSPINLRTLEKSTSGELFAIFPTVYCPSPMRQMSRGKIIIAGPCSKTAFVAFLVMTTVGALATASAQPADIKAIDKAFQAITRAEITLPPRSMHRSLSGWQRHASEPTIPTTLLRSTNWASCFGHRASMERRRGSSSAR